MKIVPILIVVACAACAKKTPPPQPAPDFEAVREHADDSHRALNREESKEH